MHSHIPRCQSKSLGDILELSILQFLLITAIMKDIKQVGVS